MLKGKRHHKFVNIKHITGSNPGYESMTGAVNSSFSKSGDLSRYWSGRWNKASSGFRSYVWSRCSWWF